MMALMVMSHVSPWPLDFTILVSATEIFFTRTWVQGSDVYLTEYLIVNHRVMEQGKQYQSTTG